MAAQTAAGRRQIPGNAEATSRSWSHTGAMLVGVSIMLSSSRHTERMSCGCGCGCWCVCGCWCRCGWVGRCVLWERARRLLKSWSAAPHPQCHAAWWQSSGSPCSPRSRCLGSAPHAGTPHHDCARCGGDFQGCVGCVCCHHPASVPDAVAGCGVGLQSRGRTHVQGTPVLDCARVVAPLAAVVTPAARRVAVVGA